MEREAAPAKVNLSLRVTGRRPDGYHELDSLVAFVQTEEVVTVAPSSEITLTITGPFGDQVPNNSDNLVLRAAAALAEAANCSLGAQITLHKAIPVAAGIGGGSADAAATLRALMRLWAVSLSETDLNILAETLGADVPVCLTGKASRMTGIGEVITPLAPFPEFGILLVNPMIPCPTPAVFRARSGTFSETSPPSPTDVERQALLRFIASEPNDLTEPALTVCPAIKDVLAELRQLEPCLLARMSGSGATCFGLFETSAEAEAAANIVKLRWPAWWTYAGTMLP